jgi:hypothetical protein
MIVLTVGNLSTARRISATMEFVTRVTESCVVWAAFCRYTRECKEKLFCSTSEVVLAALKNMPDINNMNFALFSSSQFAVSFE